MVKPCCLSDADGPADLLDDDRREALGRLVEQQQPRAGAQDAADRQHLLLAAGKLGALAEQPLLEIGKQLEDLLELSPPGLHLGRQQQIFLARRGSRRCRAPRGRRRCPARAMRSSDRPISSRPSKRTEPVRWPTMPMIDFSVVVLPAPLRPSSVTTSPARTSKVDAMEDVRLAVPGLQAFDREQRLGVGAQSWPTPI